LIKAKEVVEKYWLLLERRRNTPRYCKIEKAFNGNAEK
jgi:hypothetical protein